MEICRFKVYIQKDSLVTPFMDKMAEWLRRLTDNPFGLCLRGFDSKFVVFLIGSMLKWIAICSLNSAIRVQISEKNWYLEILSQHFHGKFTKIKITEERITNCTMFCMAS